MVEYFSRIRDLLDEMYVPFGWQKFCELSGKHDCVREVKPDVGNLREGLADKWEQFAQDLKGEAADPDYPPHVTVINIPGAGDCESKSIPAEMVSRVADLASKLATRIRRWSAAKVEGEASSSKPTWTLVIDSIGQIHAAAVRLAEAIRKQRLVNAKESESNSADAHIAWRAVQGPLLSLGHKLPFGPNFGAYFPPIHIGLTSQEHTDITQGVSRLRNAHDALMTAGFGKGYSWGEKVPVRIDSDVLKKLKHGAELLERFSPTKKKPLQPLAKLPTAPLYHAPEEEKPAEYQFGPLCGQKKDISVWIRGERKGNDRILDQKIRNQQVYVIKQPSSFEVWFKSDNAFDTARRNSQFGVK